ncbi:MAG: tryptophan synthase subunit alpha [Candidatus Atribacteria bacterium]|nr:tryptophan synthase subunit alpha [Candidatus Atribacteria bacterium]
MTDRLAETLNAKKIGKKKLFLPYLTFGYPNIPIFLDLLKVCQDQGVDAIEIGIPHSDPVADGPILQESSYHALKNGVTPEMIPEVLSSFELNVPLIAMTYGNIVFQYGIERFGKDYRQAGFQGLIVADFPLETSQMLDNLKEMLSVIILASTNTSAERLQKIGQESRGFVYIVSGKGITGKTNIDLEQIKPVITELRKSTMIPLLIGFGVNSPEMARELALVADGVIVGSAVVRFVAHHIDDPELMNKFAGYLSQYRQALDQVSVI